MLGKRRKSLVSISDDYGIVIIKLCPVNNVLKLRFNTFFVNCFVKTWCAIADPAVTSFECKSLYHLESTSWHKVLQGFVIFPHLFYHKVHEFIKRKNQP